MAAPRIALVTGANKGIGFDIARQLAMRGMTVLATARDAARGEAAAARLRAERLDVWHLPLDVACPESVAVAAKQVGEEFGRLDVLVNNAAILLDEGRLATELADGSLQASLDTNLLGVVRVTRAMLPWLRKSRSGRIVNISSSGGSLSQMAAGGAAFAPAYQISKAALNAYTLLLAAELKPIGIQVNAVCPGWVRTDMGGPSALLTSAEGADTPVWLATQGDDGPTGGFFQERRPVAW